MRVAFVDYVLDPSKPGRTGLSDLVWDMAAQLARLGEEVHVVGPYTAAAAPAAGVHVHTFALPPIGYRNIAGHLLIVLAARRTLASLGAVDVVHVPEYLSAAVLATVLRRTPVVFTEPGNIFERVARGNPYDPVTTLVYKWAARRAAAASARLIATSEEMAEWWCWTGVRPDRISHIPLGIDPLIFRRVPDARAALGWAADVPAVVYAARLSRENGVDLALRAIARVRTHGTDCHLHVLGDGPERSALGDLAHSLGLDDAVTWHGWVDMASLPTYYSAADVFAFAGRSGGTPRVLLQAMACGAPVVATAIGGIVDHVRQGENGVLVPSGDAESLASAVLDLLTDREKAATLGEQAAAYAHTSVTWDVLARRIRDEVYARVVRPEAKAMSEAALSAAYDPIAEQTALYPEFYTWVAGHVRRAVPRADAALLDVGCGTGRMLAELAGAGYTGLSGVDFSERSVALTRQRLPLARVWQHNIVDGSPGAERFDGIVMTEVIEHVTDPVRALRNVRDSLKPDGELVLTFPNRQAYWPWYYAGRFHTVLPRSARLQHWFTWFTLPYEMRSTQPIDHAYSVDEVRTSLRRAGFRIVREDGMRLFPMLRIGGWPWTDRLAELIERRLGRIVPRWLFYRYLFVCRRDDFDAG